MCSIGVIQYEVFKKRSGPVIQDHVCEEKDFKFDSRFNRILTESVKRSRYGRVSVFKISLLPPHHMGTYTYSASLKPPTPTSQIERESCSSLISHMKIYLPSTSWRPRPHSPERGLFFSSVSWCLSACLHLTYNT